MSMVITVAWEERCRMLDVVRTSTVPSSRTSNNGSLQRFPKTVCPVFHGRTARMLLCHYHHLPKVLQFVLAKVAHNRCIAVELSSGNEMQRVSSLARSRLS